MYNDTMKRKWKDAMKAIKAIRIKVCHILDVAIARAITLIKNDPDLMK